jgi:uncharacterized protein YjbJ (UPF0337 family)
MNKNQVTGRVEEAKGAVKEAAGKLVNNDKLQAEGAVQKNAGKVEKNLADAHEKVKDQAKDAADKL